MNKIFKELFGFTPSLEKIIDDVLGEDPSEEAAAGKKKKRNDKTKRRGKKST